MKNSQSFGVVTKSNLKLLRNKSSTITKAMLTLKEEIL